MRSITKRDLSRDEIAGLLRQALGAQVELRDVVEFTDGYFNADPAAGPGPPGRRAGPAR
ncbi:hypothetical protein [Micromonospora sp. NPDC000442]|uniref:hypothetical protein n=1 Tax=Micromonospora sp. NPDC000442 TaxID=3364217 RepID=UPI0036A86E28